MINFLEGEIDILISDGNNSRLEPYIFSIFKDAMPDVEFNFINQGISKKFDMIAEIQVNDRFTERKGKYFNIVQPLQHHSNCPAPGINVYSFAITPEDHQPSVTCNFSRIDNAHLNVTVTNNTISSTYNSGNAKIRIYAVNYNILRIMSGMAGLAYSN